MIEDCRTRATAIFTELDNAPSPQFLRFLKAINLLFLADPSITLLEMSEIIHRVMPNTIDGYNASTSYIPAE